MSFLNEHTQSQIPSSSSPLLQPQIRQEGFHLPSPNHTPDSHSPPHHHNLHNQNQNSSDSPGPAPFDPNAIFNISSSYGLPDAFRKFPAPQDSAIPSMDFTEELASLINNPPASHERSTHSPPDHHSRPHQSHPHQSHHPSQSHSHQQQQHQAHQHQMHQQHNPSYDDAYRSAGTMFDVPGAHFSLPQQAQRGQDGAGHGLHDFPPPTHFNSTLPALNSSMRYEPHGEQGQSQVQGQTQPQAQNQNQAQGQNQSQSQSQPANFASHHDLRELRHHHPAFRGTPSPINTHPAHHAHHAHHHTNSHPQTSHTSRSRSRSRAGGRARAPSIPPLSLPHLPNSHPNQGHQVPPLPLPLPISVNGGPTRTPRGRRTGSVSSSSPPPLSGRPQAIIIPGARVNGGANGANGSANGHGGAGGGGVSPMSLPLHGLGGTSGWFIPSHGGPSSEYALPTPESLTHTLHHPHHPQNQHPHPSQQQQMHAQYNFGISPNEPLHLAKSGLNGVNVSGVFGHGHGHGHSASISGHTPVTPTSNGLAGGVVGSSGPPTGTGGNASGPGTGADKQTMLANEKRRRRRESHNAVERRRRDNINEKISELATLIPECMLDPQGPTTSPTSALSPTDDPLLAGLGDGAGVTTPGSAGGAKKELLDDGAGVEGGVVKANKGMILRKSVEYIRYLQQLVSAQASRNRELEQQLAVCRSSSGTNSSGSLGGIGIGLTGNTANLGSNGKGVKSGNSAKLSQINMGMGMHTPTSSGGSPKLKGDTSEGDGDNDNDHDHESGGAEDEGDAHADDLGMMLHEEVGEGFGMNFLGYSSGFIGNGNGSASSTSSASAQQHQRGPSLELHHTHQLRSQTQRHTQQSRSLSTGRGTRVSGGVVGVNGKRGHSRHAHSTSGSMFELASMPEGEGETEEGDATQGGRMELDGTEEGDPSQHHRREREQNADLDGDVDLGEGEAEDGRPGTRGSGSAESSEDARHMMGMDMGLGMLGGMTMGMGMSMGMEVGMGDEERGRRGRDGRVRGDDRGMEM